MGAKTFKLLIVFVLSAGLTAFADDQATIKKPPTVSAEKGQPYILTWPDGREARLKIATDDSAPLKARFKIIDNDCTEYQNMECTYGFTLRRVFLDFVWTKNPVDPDRIGKIVQYGNKNSDGSGSFQDVDLNVGVSTGMIPGKNPILNKGLPKHTIECDDFRWLPSRTKDAPSELSISRWDGEENSRNSETGNNEARTTNGFLGLKLKAVSRNQLEIESAEGMTGFAENLQLLNISASQSVTFQPEKGKVCQAGLSNNLVAQLTPTFDQLGQKLPNVSERPDFIVGSSEVLEDPDVGERLNYIFFSDKDFK